MRIVSIAAIVGGLIAASVSAVAAETLTEPFSITLKQTLNLNGNQLPSLVGTSNQFALFNPDTGTLDDVSVMFSGAFAGVTATGATMTFDLIDLNSNIVGSDIIQVPQSFSGTPIKVSGSNSFDTTNRLEADFIREMGPVSNGQFNLFVGTPGLAAIQSGGGITGTITYDYTPTTATPSVPETSTWAMMLVGFAGLAFAGRSARGGFVNRTRSAGAC